MIRCARIEGSVAFVPLTKGYEAIIDKDDLHLVAGLNWFAHVKSRNVYAIRNSSLQQGKRNNILMHRVIIDPPAGVQVDHINGNGLDNRRSNLRIASNAENAWNSHRYGQNASGYRGVWWHARSRRWRSEIKVNNKRHNLGLHETAEAAYAAYCQAQAEFHGEFARRT